jgi:hypothetical protein
MTILDSLHYVVPRGIEIRGEWYDIVIDHTGPIDSSLLTRPELASELAALASCNFDALEERVTRQLRPETVQFSVTRQPGRAAEVSAKVAGVAGAIFDNMATQAIPLQDKRELLSWRSQKPGTLQRGIIEMETSLFREVTTVLDRVTPLPGNYPSHPLCTRGNFRVLETAFREWQREWQRECSDSSFLKNVRYEQLFFPTLFPCERVLQSEMKRAIDSEDQVLKSLLKRLAARWREFHREDVQTGEWRDRASTVALDDQIVNIFLANLKSNWH